jgi:phage gp46-like protein
MTNALNYYGNNGERDPFEHAGTTDDDQLFQIVTACLFSDARADDDAEIPDGTNNRRGWWADAYEGVEDNNGSLLWTLDRAPLDDESARLAKGYAEESLQVIIDDGIVAGIVVSTERGGTNRLSLIVEVQREGEPPVSLRYDDLWEAIENG